MNKKKFPRAILQTADEMRATAATSFGATAPDPFPAHEVVELTPRPRVVFDADAPLPPVTRADPHAAEKRRHAAEAIVERYANLAGVSGVIPIPIANVASITAIIWRMVAKLSDLYSVPYERERVRSVVIGVIGGVVPNGLSSVTVSTLFYVIPGANLLGLAVCSVAAAGCTRRIGRIFIDLFESGATFDDFPVMMRS